MRPNTPFRDMDYYLQYIRKLPVQEPLSDEEAQQLKEQGDIDALFNAHASLVPYIIQKYVDDAFRRENYADMVQEGNIAILKAIKSWKPNKGQAISTWCYMHIRRDILREMKKDLRFNATHLGYDFSDENEQEQIEYLTKHQEDATIPDHSDDGEWEEAQSAIMEFKAIRRAQPNRDRIVLDMLLAGNNQTQIADQLGLSQGRVSKLIKDMTARITAQFGE